MGRRHGPGAPHPGGTHTGSVRHCAISPDGSTLASSSSDGTIRLWETGPPPSGYGVRRVVSTAGSLAAQLTEDHEWVFEAIDAVESDQTLDRAVRDEALRLLYSQFGRMNEKSWSIARSPEKSAAEYRLAIRESTGALRGDPDNAMVINTLGVA
ncbi:MAG: hypothetical protein IH987_04945 [Planctomycetes bacterium]|nr:hypothetical protein [Planctomycetota bacterium]